jgi:antitoxin VapB
LYLLISIKTGQEATPNSKPGVPDHDKNIANQEPDVNFNISPHDIGAQSGGVLDTPIPSALKVDPDAGEVVGHFYFCNRFGIYLDIYHRLIYTIGIYRRRTMNHIGKIFMNGRSQAVRLPFGFRFKGKEVYVRKDEKTGDVILSQRPDDWAGFFAMADATDEAKDFLKDRKDTVAQERELF